MNQTLKPAICLATLPQATAQEVFDQCARHLLTQNERCKNERFDSCAYRNELGLKCAAGCFISDEEYKRDLEGKGWDSLVNKEFVPSDHNDLIWSLQLVHDNNLVASWKEKLKLVADKYKLDFSVLDEFQNQ